MTLQHQNEVCENRPDEKTYFFDKGLKFECLSCGKCCNGAPGIIIVLKNEIEAISNFLELDNETFIKHFLYPYSDEYSIREDDTGRCIFVENGCSIYAVRPLQCRTYPFWFTNLCSIQEWEDVLKKCPGAGQGRLYSKDEILEIAEASMHLYKPFCQALGLIEKQ